MRLLARLSAVALVCCFAFLGQSSTVFGQGSSPSTEGGASLSSSPFVIAGAQILDEGQQARDTEAALRSSPEALVAREASQTAYENLDAEQAKSLARTAFPAVIEHPAGGPPQLPSGQHITAFASDNTAALDLGAGKRGVIESREPMAIETAHGGHTPIDLGLADIGDAYSPATPAVEVRIPKRLGDGVQLPRSGVSLVQVDASGSPLQGSEGKIAGAAVLYANTALDTDTVIKPETSGFAADTLLRSQDSPQRLLFKLGLPDGAKAIEATDGSGAIEVLKEQTTIAVLLPPAAHDAAGTTVPVSMSLSGDIAAVTVVHRAGEYQMPIEVDPTAVEPSSFNVGPGPWLAGPKPLYANWTAEWWITNKGLQIRGPNNTCCRVAAGTFAYFQYHTQGNSEIYALNVTTTGQDKEPLGGHARISEYIQAGGYQQAGGELPMNEPTEYAFWICTYSDCSPTQDSHVSNTAYWQVSAGTEETFFTYTATNAYVYITQNEPPRAETDTTDAYLGGSLNAFNPETNEKTGWVNGSNAIGFNGFDPGIGVYNYQIHTYPTDEPGWSGRVSGTPNQGGQCTGMQCSEAWTFWTKVGNLPDGIDQVQGTAQNATGASASTVGTVKVDNTPPTITLSGELAEANGKTVGQGSYQLNASLQDGTGTVPSSGLAYGKILVDGKWGLSEFGSGTGAAGCTPGPCARELSYTLDAAKLAAGRHEVEVRATDHAGNETKKQIVITVGAAASAPVGPGTVNLATGAFTLKAQDVSVPTPSGPLTVGRSYSSNELSGNSDGLGPQWRLNLPRSQFQKLERRGSNITARENGGASLNFYSLGGSTYYGPGEQMRITTSGTSATLTDRSGDITTFSEAPTGSSIYVLSSVQTPGTQGATTYTMEPSGSKTRPKQVVAPPPAGVSCATLVKGCRALGFVYSGTKLKQITFTAWDPAKGEMTTTPVAEYQVSLRTGYLTSAWDPRISPALKTTYGYDEEGHVTAVTPPGQQPYLVDYGSIKGDTSTGRAMSLTRPGAATVEGTGEYPENKTLPKFGTPKVGTTLKLSHGSWTDKPLAYTYQWEECNAAGAECERLSGATNAEYTPQAKDAGYTLKAQVTAENSGGATTATTATSSVIALISPAYSLAFGSKGSGTGQLDGSGSEASDASGDIWVVEFPNNRISEFSPSGAFMASVGWGVTDGKAQLEVCKASCRAGIAGSGNGQFYNPWGIAINKSTGNIYVSDQANARIEEFSSTGAFITAFGSPGAGPQQFGTLAGLAIEPATGDLWVADFGNNRVSKFSPSGTNLAIIGSAGSGNGQLSNPLGIALSGGNIYVNDYSNHRIEEFTPSGAYVRQFGAKGTEPGQFSESGPYGIATEPVSGDLYVTDCAADSVQVFNPSGGYVTKFGVAGTGNGQLACPTGIVSSPSGEIYVDDSGNGRVEKWNPKYSTKNPAPEPPEPGTTAVATLEYKVPMSGSGQAYAMSPKDVEAWGQKDDPVEATAIFAPDEVPASPAADHKRATVFYLDRAGKNVNTAEPGGRISTSEYDEQRLNPIRTLTPANRQRALEAGSGSAALSTTLDTQMSYNARGTALASELGPRHTVKLASGTQTEARVHVQYTYDEENAPTGKPYDLLTRTTSGAQIGGEQPEADVRTTTYSYSGQENLGLKLRKPTSVTIDAGGQNLVHTTLYEPGTGNVEETRQPMSSGGADPRSSQSIYYTAGANLKLAACGNHAEWAGLLCRAQPAAQPEGSSPAIPVVTQSSYNLWQEPLTTVESSGGSSRTSSNSYDAAGRPASSSVEGTEGSGRALPAVSVEYDQALGLPVKQSTGSGASLKRITSSFNKLGQLVSYTDADGNQSTYAYDVDGRATESSDGKGSQVYEYDPITGALGALKDSAAGSFTATYDADGNLSSAIYPNGMCATYGYNSADEPTSLQYAKTTNCGESGAPVWFSDAIVPSIHSQWMSQASTLSSQSYKYDNPGRLTEVQDTPAGQGCTTRVYAYDGDSNRTSLTSREPLSNGNCATTGGTKQQFAHDTADRLTDSGISYEQFGSTTTLPSSDAGGSPLTSSYYINNHTATQSQAGATVEVRLDPAGRERETITSGTSASTVTSHFMGGTDAPAWTVDAAGTWTRYISGITGLAAIQTSGATPVLQLENLHGDVVATAALNESATKLLSTTDSTEFGVPRAAPGKYAWLGGAQRSTELPSGAVSMGVRAYIPQLGRFEQPDPIEGGSANAYDYSGQDPVNNADLGGASYETPYTPVLDASGNEIAQGYGVEAVEIYQAILQAAKERQEAEEAAYWASRETQEAEFLSAQNLESTYEMCEGSYVLHGEGCEGGGGSGGGSFRLLTYPVGGSHGPDPGMSECNRTGQKCSGCRSGSHNKQGKCVPGKGGPPSECLKHAGEGAATGGAGGAMTGGGLLPGAAGGAVAGCIWGFLKEHT